MTTDTHKDLTTKLRILDMWAGERIGLRAGNRYDVQGSYRGRTLQFEIEALSQLSFYLDAEQQRIDKHLAWISSF